MQNAPSPRSRRGASALFFLTALLALGADAVRAASPEWEMPATSHKDVKPYVDVTALQAVTLPAPPAEGSRDDRDDVAAVLARQQVDAARRASAEADGDQLYDRFAPLLGIELRRERFPALIALLNRSVRQAGQPAFAAKTLYKRLRPYQRLSLDHVCGRSGRSAPDPDAQQRTSYPSGHSTYGWTTALVLARVAPDRAPALLARARDYAESRLICGMHFPSDVEAGRQLATAVVSQLDLNPEFQQDLLRARAELAAAR
ncbi:phosphatase PAP2 family protein [Mitsuaria sp. GD03876]|uniref:acid phosphatase n=1 Tax=Mitsuaria sp. GD03876 TaxID=2975399 RepID=UPI00244B07F0|nr:phosphatase PAP2 family protein [Mitsuaria sp. GD03876]MDH0864996.1 phosphatase PAP2 family protein [Mitsuaria sp. GD03876]